RATTRTGARSCPDARACVYCQRRNLQRIYFPRHRPDRGEAGTSRRLRLRACERFLFRHLGFEHQLARRLRPLQPLESGVGLLRRLQAELPRSLRGLLLRRRLLRLRLSGRKNPGVTSADTWELYGALGWKWVSVKVSYSL